MICSDCKQERGFLNNGLCILCIKAQERASEEEGNWKKKVYPIRGRGVEI